jgi:hypothetical protein
MKRVVPTLTAAIFALGLVSAGLAQTSQTPEKPKVKTETSAPAVVKSEVAKPGEKTGAETTVKPGVKKATKKAAKKEKKCAKKGKNEKKSGA